MPSIRTTRPKRSETSNLKFQISARSGRRGAVLLEIVVGMTIFFGSAAVILGGLCNSIKAWESVKLESQAADLAVSLLSEVQIGIREPVSDGPTAYSEPHIGWTWQIVVAPPAGLNQDLTLESQLLQVDVIVTYAPTGYTRRQTAILAGQSSEEAATSSTATVGGGL